MTDETVKAGDLKEGDRVRVVIEGSISFISANRSEIHIATSGTTSEHAVKVSLATITRLAPEPKAADLKPIATARKDGAAYLAKLKDVFAPNRDDLRRYHGAWFVISHPGLADGGYDLGWNAPLMGCGGWPDEWIEGVVELPWNLAEHYERTSIPISQ